MVPNFDPRPKYHCKKFEKWQKRGTSKRAVLALIVGQLSNRIYRSESFWGQKKSFPKVWLIFFRDVVEAPRTSSARPYHVVREGRICSVIYVCSVSWKKPLWLCFISSSRFLSVSFSLAYITSSLHAFILYPSTPKFLPLSPDFRS